MYKEIDRNEERRTDDIIFKSTGGKKGKIKNLRYMYKIKRNNKMMF